MDKSLAQFIAILSSETKYLFLICGNRPKQFVIVEFLNSERILLFCQIQQGCDQPTSH